MSCFEYKCEAYDNDPNDSSMDGQVQYSTPNNNIGACPRFEQSSKNNC